MTPTAVLGALDSWLAWARIAACQRPTSLGQRNVFAGPGTQPLNPSRDSERLQEAHCEEISDARRSGPAHLRAVELFFAQAHAVLFRVWDLRRHAQPEPQPRRHRQILLR